MMQNKNYLLLQPHPSLFDRTLLKELRIAGANCHIINISLGDWIYRLGLGAVNYLGTLDSWQEFLEEFIKKHNITKIIYYSDQRPYHRIARKVALNMNIGVYAYEHGYLRPDWITLEKSGMGVFSHFPDDPKLIKKLSKNINYPLPTTTYGHGLFIEAVNEVLYNLTPALLPFLFKNFERDRYYHPIIDYPSYIPRLLLRKHYKKTAKRVIEKLIASGNKYYVIPLQMQADYQVRRCSNFAHMSEMVDEVIGSFSKNAPDNSQLIFKLHPLDNNLEGWHGVINKIAKQYGCQKRIIVIDMGDLELLLEHSCGTVVINSTVGLTALQMNVPVKVLGIALYDVKGMTFQGNLDEFWCTAPAPDADLVKAFTKLLAHTIQIKGSFFSKEGRQAAAKEFTRKIIEDDINQAGTYVSPPPRLKKATEMSVPMIYENNIDYN